MISEGGSGRKNRAQWQPTSRGENQAASLKNGAAIAYKKGVEMTSSCSESPLQFSASIMVGTATAGEQRDGNGGCDGGQHSNTSVVVSGTVSTGRPGRLHLTKSTNFPLSEFSAHGLNQDCPISFDSSGEISYHSNVGPSKYKGIILSHPCSMQSTTDYLYLYCKFEGRTHWLL